MSFITRLLESIFPFLFSALKRAWDNLTSAQQTAIVQSGIIGQYLKKNLDAGSGDVINGLTSITHLPQSVIENTLLQLASKLGMDITAIDSTAANAVTFIQNKLKGASSNEEWNGLLQIIMNSGATILTGGGMDWLHLSLGIAEWAYRQFVEPLNIPILTIVSNIVDANVTTTKNTETPSETSTGQPQEQASNIS